MSQTELQNCLETENIVVTLSYRLILLPGHVSSEDCLHGQSSSLFLPVAFSLDVHSLVLLNDGGCLRAAHKLGQTEKQETESQNFILGFLTTLFT